MMQNSILLSSFITCQAIAIGQVGPGGVGNSTNNVLWIKADAGTNTTVNGANITNWNDQSGNSVDFTQANVNQQPIFASNLMNGRPGILFDNVNATGQNDFLQAPDHPLLDNTNGYSFFTVSRLNNNNSNARAIISKRVSYNNPQSFTLFYQNSNQFNVYIAHSNHRFQTSTSQTAGVNRILNSFYDGTLSPSIYTANIWNEENFQVNSLITPASAIIPPFVPDYNTPVTIGSFNLGDNRPFDGYVSEIIIYRTKVNKASRIIINNYLSAKYNIPLTANDYYWGDNPVNGDYDRDVAGIGKDTIMPGAVIGSNDAFATSASAGLGISTVSSSSLDVGDYILAGHRTPVNSDNYTDVAGIPGTYPSRWERIWQVSVTNTGADISANVVFDMSDAGMFPDLSNAAASDYLLVYRPGLSGAWTVVATASSLVGDQVFFNNFTFVNSGYYTLSTQNFNISPLPIELLSFDAKNISGSHVQLDWATATELNNDYFVVQKTPDGQLWEEVVQVDGQLNSQTTTYYTNYDYRPYPGTSYYRLKQVDTDGNFKFSPLRSVHFDLPPATILFPNPVSNVLHISTNQLELNAKIINSLGQEVVNREEIQQNGAGLYQVDVGKLSSGVYFFINGKDKHKLIKSN